jgi:predicted signal transduction protein with EAL and GGDEF domain
MQLQEPRFIDRLKELLARHSGIQPSKLELEVLESSAFQDVAQVSEVIRACSKLGVSFALRLWNGVFFAVVFEAIAGRCSEDRSKFCA